jgi:hypothetical protein
MTDDGIAGGQMADSWGTDGRYLGDRWEIFGENGRYFGKMGHIWIQMGDMWDCRRIDGSYYGFSGGQMGGNEGQHRDR